MSHPEIEIRYADGRSERRVLEPGSYRVGREIGDVVLGDPNVSSQHAQIDVYEQHLTVTDLGSTNGVLDGAGRRISGSHLLRPGQSVRMGECTLMHVLPVPARGGTRVMPEMPARGGTRLMPQIPEPSPSAGAEAASAAHSTPAASAPPAAASVAPASVVARSGNVSTGARRRAFMPALLIGTLVGGSAWMLFKTTRFFSSLGSSCPEGTWRLEQDERYSGSPQSGTISCEIDDKKWLCEVGSDGYSIRYDDMLAGGVTYHLSGEYSYTYVSTGPNRIRLLSADTTKLQSRAEYVKNTGLMNLFGAMLGAQESANEGASLGTALAGPQWKERYWRIRGDEIEVHCDDSSLRTFQIGSGGAGVPLHTFSKAD